MLFIYSDITVFGTVVEIMTCFFFFFLSQNETIRLNVCISYFSITSYDHSIKKI
jgi:hypothetical protein